MRGGFPLPDHRTALFAALKQSTEMTQRAKAEVRRGEHDLAITFTLKAVRCDQAVEIIRRTTLEIGKNNHSAKCQP